MASETNTIIAEQHTKQILGIDEHLAHMKRNRTDITASSWLDKYESVQEERLKYNELCPNSSQQEAKSTRLFREYYGVQCLGDITVLDTSEITDAVKAEGRNRMAQIVRMVLMDILKEA